MSNDKKHIYVDSFLHNLKVLIKEVMVYLPTSDPKVYRINKRIMLAIQLDPAMCFNKVGSYLYKYRKFIYDASTEELLLQWDFIEAYDEDDKELEDVSLLVIAELKKCMSKMNKEQKDYYRAMVASLLDDYIEYTCPE
jgi:hypothetical protein